MVIVKKFILNLINLLKERDDTTSYFFTTSNISESSKVISIWLLQLIFKIKVGNYIMVYFQKGKFNQKKLDKIIDDLK